MTWYDVATNFVTHPMQYISAAPHALQQAGSSIANVVTHPGEAFSHISQAVTHPVDTFTNGYQGARQLHMSGVEGLQDMVNAGKNALDHLAQPEVPPPGLARAWHNPQQNIPFLKTEAVAPTWTQAIASKASDALEFTNSQLNYVKNSPEGVALVGAGAIGAHKMGKGIVQGAWDLERKISEPLRNKLWGVKPEPTTPPEPPTGTTPPPNSPDTPPPTIEPSADPTKVTNMADTVTDAGKAASTAEDATQFGAWFKNVGSSIAKYAEDVWLISRQLIGKIGPALKTFFTQAGKVT